ncbi:MAG: DUF4332 domain-containing protein [Fibrobacter sp.]|nr:DUF4332 domain-containing protein [Fibrobacter sp.]
MNDEYYVDLNNLSLSDYLIELEQTELLPSRRILKEDLQKRFSILAKHGIKNLQEILYTLKTSAKVQSFSKQTGIPEIYLTILKREIASMQPKPVNLSDFQGIDNLYIQALAQIQINHTRQLFNLIKIESDRKRLSKQAGIPYTILLELTKLTDVSRIRWVGAKFARLLVDSPCDTVEKVSIADYKELYTRLKEINDEKKYFRGMFGMNDMKLCILAAVKVPNVIRY